MRPAELIDVCHRSHRVLLAGVDALTDGDLRAPSLLPGYSRGHVLRHLVNKARAHVRVLGGPAAGEVRRLHPEGHDPDAAAADGAHRPVAELRADLADALGELKATWDALDGSHWEEHALMAAGPRTLREVVGHHLRNVEVHHVDLDIGHGPGDWPALLVESELPKRLRTFPDRADHAEILAWLLGRGAAPGLTGPW